MEDIYLFMQTKNKRLPGLYLEEEQYILDGDFKDPVRKGFLVEKEIDEDKTMQIILPIKSIINEKYFVNEDGVIEECDPCYKHCNSHNFIKKGYNCKTICLEVFPISKIARVILFILIFVGFMFTEMMVYFI